MLEKCRKRLKNDFLIPGYSYLMVLFVMLSRTVEEFGMMCLVA